MHSSPFEQFKIWQSNANVEDKTEAALATATKNGIPSVRMVLVKNIDKAGFTFYTNLESRKAQELKQNPNGALLFYWKDKQIRVSGTVEQVSDAKADKYFDSRPKESNVVSILSHQSQVLEDEKKFLAEIDEYNKNYQNKKLKRPDYWTGFLLKVSSVEFWIRGNHRCHSRFLYTLKADGKWKICMLYP